MVPLNHIDATGGTDFYQQVAIFAYGSYIELGYGAVIVTEGEFRVHGGGRVEASLTYIPFSQEAELPDEVIEQINDYDPELQCVFAMVDSVRISVKVDSRSGPKWTALGAKRRWMFSS
jgi:hypothetical protein